MGSTSASPKKRSSISSATSSQSSCTHMKTTKKQNFFSIPNGNSLLLWSFVRNKVRCNHSIMHHGCSAKDTPDHLLTSCKMAMKFLCCNHAHLIGRLKDNYMVKEGPAQWGQALHPSAAQQICSPRLWIPSALLLLLLPVQCPNCVSHHPQAHPWHKSDPQL